MRLNKSDVRRQIQLLLCHFSNKINHTHPCLMACVMMDLPLFPTKSIICCLPPSTGPKRTDSSGLVWRPTKHLSQGRLCESSRFAGHRHVERQHLRLQRWTGGPAADRSDVECTLRMLAWIRLTPPPTVAKSTYSSFLTIKGFVFALCSGMHTCTSGLLWLLLLLSLNVAECPRHSSVPTGRAVWFVHEIKILLYWEYLWFLTLGLLKSMHFVFNKQTMFCF